MRGSQRVCVFSAGRSIPNENQNSTGTARRWLVPFQLQKSRASRSSRSRLRQSPGDPPPACPGSIRNTQSQQPFHPLGRISNNGGGSCGVVMNSLVSHNRTAAQSPVGSDARAGAGVRETQTSSLELQHPVGLCRAPQKGRADPEGGGGGCSLVRHIWQLHQIFRGH